MASAAAYGCIACRKDGHPDTPAEIHHITSGGRRMGHLFSLPLCSAHHRGDGRMVPSVHFHRKAFERAYGLQGDLLAELQVALNVYDKVEQ